MTGRTFRLDGAAPRKFWASLDLIERVMGTVLVLCFVVAVGALGMALWQVVFPPPPCLRGHHETVVVPILVGKVIVMMPEDEFVCDKRAAR